MSEKTPETATILEPSFPRAAATAKNKGPAKEPRAYRGLTLEEAARKTPPTQITDTEALIDLERMRLYRQGRIRDALKRSDPAGRRSVVSDWADASRPTASSPNKSPRHMKSKAPCMRPKTARWAGIKVAQIKSADVLSPAITKAATIELTIPVTARMRKVSPLGPRIAKGSPEP